MTERRPTSPVAGAVIRLAPALAVALLVHAEPAAADDSIWSEIAGQRDTGDGAALAEAESARAMGRYADALIAVQAVLDASPDDPAANALALAIHFAEGDDARVMAHADALASGDSAAWSDPRVAYFHALALARTGDVAGASSRLEGAIRYRPGLEHAAFYLTAMGELRLAEHDLDAAALFFRQALTADSDFAHARLGLAVVHARQGRMAAARAESVPVVLPLAGEDHLGNPSSTFFVPEGQIELYRAIVADASGDSGRATEALLAWADSPAGAGVDPAAIEHMRDGFDRQLAAYDVWPTGCDSIGRMDIAPETGRVAVRCDGSSVRIARVAGATAPRFETVTGLSWGRNDASLAWATVDLAWSDDGERLHLLYTSGMSETIAWSGTTARSEGLLNYAADELVPVGFGEDPDVVLWSGLWGSGAMVSDRATVPVSGSPSYLPSGQSMASGAVTRAGLVVGSDGYSMDVVSGPPPWTTVATHRVTDYSAPWAVGAGGDTLWTAWGGILTEVELESMDPVRFVPLPTADGQQSRSSGSWTPTSIAVAGPDEVWVALSGRVARIRLATDPE